MARTTQLDLRKISLGASPIFATARKTDASKFALAHGWLASDVIGAANRFWQFWVVGQCIGNETIRLLNNDGTYVDMPYPGRW